jgi:two-component system response regulator RegA
VRALSAEVAPSLLIVEDDAVLRGRLVRAFRERGLEVREAADGEAALRLVESDPPEYAVVDLRMPGMPGLAVVRALKEADPTTAVVVLTGYGSIATAIEAIRFGAVHYLTKPADADEILAALRRADGAPSPVAAPPPAPSLARVEWEHINRVLAGCGGNVSQAARILGIHRRSLQRKLSKHPLPR